MAHPPLARQASSRRRPLVLRAVAAVLAGACAAGFSQSAVAVRTQPDPGLPQSAMQRARAMADAWLQKEHPRAGASGSSAIVVTAAADIGVPPGAPDYIDRREDAFRIAADSARVDVARAMGTQIKAALGSQTRLEQVLGNRELAQALVGVHAAGGGDAVEFGRQLDSLVETAAQASLAGFSLVQSFEVADGDKAAVAVVAAVSPASMSWAGGRGTVTAGKSLERWLADIPLDVLCRTYGTRFVPDDSGRMHLVAFGRQAADAQGELDEGARMVAESESRGHAARGIASSIAANSWSRSVSGTRRIQDLKPEWTQAKALSESIRVTTGDQAVGARIRTLGLRRVTDPIAGRDMWIVVAAADLGGQGARESESVSGCPEVPPEMEGSIRRLDVRGEGASYEEAVRGALREAIRQEGVFVSADADLVREFEQQMSRVQDEVSRKSAGITRGTERTRTFADGFVHSYAVVRLDERASSGGRVVVDICANVVRFDPGNPRFGGVPTIAVLPAIVKPGAVAVAGRPVDPGASARAFESAIERCLAEAPGRYRLLDDAGAPSLRDVREGIRARAERGEVPPGELMKLGQELTADYVVLVELDRLEFTGQDGIAPDVTPSDVAVCRVRCRMVNVADGSVAPWTFDAEVRLDYADGLPLPSRSREERSMAPAAVAQRRMEQRIDKSLRGFLGLAMRDGSGPGAAGPGLRVIRVSAREVSLDASNPLVRVGAKFAVENPVSVTVGSRVLIDRDRVAVIQVTSIRDGIAKARAIEGDIDLVDPVSSELSPVP